MGFTVNKGPEKRFSEGSFQKVPKFASDCVVGALRNFRRERVLASSRLFLAVLPKEQRLEGQGRVGSMQTKKHLSLARDSSLLFCLPQQIHRGFFCRAHRVFTFETVLSKQHAAHFLKIELKGAQTMKCKL